MNPNRFRISHEPNGHGFIIQLDNGYIRRCSCIEQAMHIAQQYQRHYDYSTPHEEISTEEIRRRQKQADRRAKINEIFG